VLCLPAGVWHCAKGTTTSLALNMAFDHHGGGVFDSIVTMLQQRLGDDPAWREPLPITPDGHTRRIPGAVSEILRRRIAALRAELATLEQDETQLTRAWRSTVRSPTRS
jgi:hypothetical protein